jgi:hypothetical protein
MTMKMTRHMTKAAVAAAVVLAASAAPAQESVSRPGWTFVPGFGFSETYDDNVTLFGHAEIDTANNDLIAVYTPQADLTFISRRTRFNSGYSGSLLDYRTFSLFNRWDQHANVSLQRTETRRVSWGVSGNLSLTPSTDALEFDGVPFSHTGARALNARGTVEYRLSERDSIATSLLRQKVTFDRSDELLPYLRGGETLESRTSYRRRLNARAGVGGTYSLRRASAVDEPERLTFHVTRGVVDYQLTPSWTVSGGAGLDYVPATPITPSQQAPGFSGSVNWSERSRHFHAGYERMFLPSFGFGGAVQNQSINVTYYTPLSRRLYTEHSFSLRDNRPLIITPGRLRLRTGRLTSTLGWAPRPWVRVEGFYSRAMQTTLITGGDIDRNRIGFVITTSRPVRMQ